MFIWFQKYKTVLIGGVIIVIVAILFLSQEKENNTTVIEPTLVLSNDGGEEIQNEINEEKKIMVDVKGAVERPGVYEVKEDDRVYDVIQMAGGLLETADENQINFALKVEDEMVIYIPMIGELDEVNDQWEFQSARDNGKINLNKANADDLETLPGIGPAKAAAILEYRESNGPFKKIEDIKNISGIGEKTFERLKELIIVK